ncbi:MAG: GNAT family N-acetyltransferase [Peptococcaceae bacterium]|nr:GNAT family N-acetyltransferase [Peptococcaceae bacterium]
MKIIRINDQSKYLSQVKQLWRKNSATLGYFPDGAFFQYASQRHILVCLDSKNNVIGYLMYRPFRRQVRIVHLCVDERYRRRGIASLLVEHLRKITQNFEGCGLWCRLDFEARHLWPKLGFVALSDKRGKSQTGKPLAFWWLNYGHPNLFTITKPKEEPKIQVVMDANIFYDLQSEETKENYEAKALLADWLAEDIELCLVQEIYNEIIRNKDPERRKKQREFINYFTVLQTTIEEFNRVSQILRPLFPENMTPSDESDLRQVAHAIVAGVTFFVTQDDDLINISDKVYNDFGMLILRPCDLISHLDELSREAEYQPARLAGSLIKGRLARSKELPKYVNSFLCFVQGERKKHFLDTVKRCLVNPEFCEVRVIEKSKENNPIALVAYNKQYSNVLEIPLFRIRKHSLSSTIAKHVILKAILTAARENREIIKITDPHLDENTRNALQNTSFVELTNGWIRASLSVTDTAKNLKRKLLRLANEYIEARDYFFQLAYGLERAYKKQDVKTLASIEQILWPAKITDSGIPCFIVPIKPQWAMDLFDEDLAKQTLFGAKPELVLNRENVYYRSCRPAVINSPSRVLWYVKADTRYSGSKQVRACSCVDEVVIDKPKDIFKRFRRLGVYRWKDVFEIAGNSLNGRVMAICFSNTELFRSPIPWDYLQEILLEEQGKKLPIRSPVRITDKCFFRLYDYGMQSK